MKHISWLNGQLLKACSRFKRTSRHALAFVVALSIGFTLQPVAASAQQWGNVVGSFAGAMLGAALANRGGQQRFYGSRPHASRVTRNATANHHNRSASRTREKAPDGNVSASNKSEPPAAPANMVSSPPSASSTPSSVSAPVRENAASNSAGPVTAASPKGAGAAPNGAITNVAAAPAQPAAPSGPGNGNFH